MSVDLNQPINTILSGLDTRLTAVEGSSGMPVLTFGSAVSQSEGNSGTTNFSHSFLINRKGVTGAITVVYSVTGTGANQASAADFAGGVLPSGSVIVADGQSGGSIVIPVAGDATYEPDEMYQIVASMQLGQVTTTGTILNDDSALTPYPSGMVMMLDPASLAGSLADGASVSTWTDSVGGVPFTQATASRKPTFVANAYNGQPGVRFNSANTTFLSASRAGAASALRTVIDSQIHFTYIVAIGIGAGGNSHVFGAAAPGTYGYWAYGDGGMLGRFSNLNTLLPSTDTGLMAWGFSSYNANDGNSGSGRERVYINGGCVAQSGAPIMQTGADFAIGCDASGTFPFTGTILRAFVFNRELSPVEVLQLEKAWRDRAGAPYPWATGQYASGAQVEVVIGYGDSQTANVSADEAQYGWMYQLAQARKLKYGQWSNLGIGGISTARMQARFNTDFAGTGALLGRGPKVIVGEWANSQNDGTTGSQAAANKAALIASIKGDYAGSKVALWTSYTQAQETTNGAIDAQRQTYDAYWDSSSNRGNVDAYYPVHTDAHLGVLGACPALGAGSYGPYFSDGLHLAGKAGYPGTISGQPYFAAQLQGVLTAAAF